MDRIELPLVSPDATPAEVFDRMAEHGVHAAIVGMSGGEPVLVSNREVDEALEAGLARVGQLSGTPLHVVNAEVADWEGVLDDAGRSFGVVEAAGGGGPMRSEVAAAAAEAELEPPTITIVTRHESLADDIRTAGVVCRCRNNHRAKQGEPCFCRAPVRCA
jgi:CBS domain-containing protein